MLQPPYMQETTKHSSPMGFASQGPPFSFSSLTGLPNSLKSKSRRWSSYEPVRKHSAPRRRHFTIEMIPAECDLPSTFCGAEFEERKSQIFKFASSAPVINVSVPSHAQLQTSHSGSPYRELCASTMTSVSPLTQVVGAKHLVLLC